ncbi:MAG: DUF58 domain-containing protein [Chloroflexi bacterium]|nr:DUF58 domain-containing protein [Chloroflexota bacterium]
MRRSLTPSLLLFSLILVGLATFQSSLLVLAIPLALYILLGLIFSPDKVDIEIERVLSAERVAPDTLVKVTLHLKNNGSSLEEILLEDHIPPALSIEEGKIIHFCTLAPNERKTWSYTVSGTRGSYVFSDIEIRSSDHFGLVYHQEVLKIPGQLFVIPRVPRLRNITIRPRHTRVYAGTIPARVGGTGIDFFGVREYQTGDSLRRINWRTSARHQQNLFTNEFEQERAADVGIILDGRKLSNIGRDGHSLFEHTVSAAAGLADHFLSTGNRVGILFYGRVLRWSTPGYGNIQRERLLQALARAKTGDSQVFTNLDNLPTQLFPPNSQLVLVTPLVKGDAKMLIQLRSRGYQIMVVSPDPISYELRGLPDNPDVKLAARVLRTERNMVLMRLKRSGLQVVDWDVNIPLDRILESRLGRPPAWHNATGK